LPFAVLTGVDVSDLTFLLALLDPAFFAGGISSSLDSALIPLDFLEAAGFAVDFRRGLAVSRSSSLSLAFAFFLTGAAVAFFSSLRISTVTFSACLLPVSFFFTADFLPIGASESEGSSI
jgi:hypothetical protein